MKVRQFMQGSLLVFAALLSSCSNETYDTTSNPTNALKISVVDAGAYGSQTGTRAVQHEYATSFSPNDAIGVFEVKDGKVTHSNVKYVFDGTRWNSLHGIAYDASATYYAYFPYAEDRAGIKAQGSTVSTTTADDFFADVISAFTPLKDQSIGANYDASDLMVSKGNTPADGNTITFPMYHKMGLAILELGNITYVWDSNYKWDSPIAYNFVGENQPLTYDSKCRYIVKPGVTNNLTIKDGNLLSVVNVKEAGKYQTYKIGGEMKYDPQIGDIYYSDGSLTHAYDGRRTPIGILGYIYKNDGVTEAGYDHGLVIGLKMLHSASLAFPAGLESSGLFPVRPSLEDQLTEYGGLAKTNWLREHNSEMTKTLDQNYVSAPDNSKHKNSGWFIPASGQLAEVAFHKLGGLNDENWDNRTYTINDRVANNFDNYCRVVGVGNYDGFDKAVTSSRASSDSWIKWNLYDFSSIYNLDNGGDKIRPMLAF